MTYKDESIQETPANAKKSKELSNHIFISYSHKDSEYKDEIVTTLQGLRYAGIEFEFWCDDQIHAGEDWFNEIKEKLDRCGVAIALVSRYFMASEFIQKKEMPTLLEKAKGDGTRLLSIIVRRCSFKDTPLSKYQAINNPDQSLLDLSPADQERVYLKLVDEVKRYLNAS